MRVASLHVYPIKSCRGIPLLDADVLLGGIRHDRRFQIVTPAGEFLTQREHPTMALVETALDEHALHVTTPHGSVSVPFESLSDRNARMPVTIWEDAVNAVVVPGAIAELLSTLLRLDVRLVAMPEDEMRQVDPHYAKPGDRVGFADGFPILLANVASLADLNARLERHVPMNRFRANIVVEGAADAFEEDKHDAVMVGAIPMRMSKRCSRCAIVTVDQRTGETSKEPLKTLAKYRTVSNKVYFAQNCIPDAEGHIEVGDIVKWL